MADWFVPKKYGLGATPASWQGWAIIAGYAALMALAGFTLPPRHWTVWMIVIVALTLSVSLIAAQNTRGGWRWRWGDDQ